MRLFACICCFVLVLGACSEPSNQPAAGADSAQMAPPAPAGPNLADLAGTWNFRVMPATGDSVLTTNQIIVTADTTGWQLLLPNRPPVPIHVGTVAGDSVVLHAGPFESVLRPGNQVTTEIILHFQGNNSASGTVTARYPGVTTADSVATLRTDGTKSM